MERPSIVILVGISGCGKTTWCNNYIDEATILSMDSIRKEVFNNASDQSHNEDVARIFNKQLEDEIALKHNIVIDNSSYAIVGDKEKIKDFLLSREENKSNSKH